MSTRRGRTPAFGRMARLVVGALAVAAVVTTSALAGTIVGTAKNDTIRGTARADKLYGRGGNDSLFGMAGGDYLNGGPGKDRFSCGAGRDTVVAEKGESVARDCEVVRRTGGTTTTPPPTTPAPPTPPPPAPPPPPPAPPPAKAGFFGGFASTGGSVNFVVAADGRSLSRVGGSATRPTAQPPGTSQLRDHLQRNGQIASRRHVLRERNHVVGHHGEVQRNLRRGRYDGVGTLPGPRSLRPGRSALRVRLGRGGLVGQVAGLKPR